MKNFICAFAATTVLGFAGLAVAEPLFEQGDDMIEQWNTRAYTAYGESFQVAVPHDVELQTFDEGTMLTFHHQGEFFTALIIPRGPNATSAADHLVAMQKFAAQQGGDVDLEVVKTYTNDSGEVTEVHGVSTINDASVELDIVIVTTESNLYCLSVGHMQASTDFSNQYLHSLKVVN